MMCLYFTHAAGFRDLFSNRLPRCCVYILYMYENNSGSAGFVVVVVGGGGVGGRRVSSWWFELTSREVGRGC